MVKEFEALVSHLFVVGGRAVSAPPPGALVQVAPRRVSRSRERDAIFVLVLPSGDQQANAMFYEQMARQVAERYFASKGGVTVGLRGALDSLNNDLLAHNKEHPDNPYYADVLCLVLREEEVYVAKTTASLLLLWQDGEFNTFPYDLTGSQLRSGRPLGYTPQPDIKLNRYHVAAGHMIALSDAGLAAVPADKLAADGQQNDVQAVVTALKAHNLQDTTTLLLQIIPPEAPTPQAAPAAPPAATAASPSPTPQAASAAPPAESAPATLDEKPAETAAPARKRFWQRGGRQTDASGHVVPTGTRAEAAQPSLRSRIGNLAQRGRQQQEVLAETAGPALEKVQVESRNIFQRVARGALRLLQRLLLRLSTGIGGLRKLLDKMLPEPEPGKPPSLPTPIAAGAAILIPIAVVLLVVALTLSTRDETAFERCLTQAQTALQIAEDISTNGNGDPQEAWFTVMDTVNLCLPRRADDPLLLSIRDTAQRALDDFSQVTRCPAVPLRAYQPGADVRGPILRNDVDLYTLDTTRSVLYRDVLNEAGNALLGEGETLAQRGSAVGEFVIRDLFDLAWLTDVGASRGNMLVAVDEQGVLLSYSPTFPPATAQRLVGADQWMNPVAIATWQGKLYILDPLANQIWRYQPVAGAFPGAPEEYFIGDNRPDLRDAVDIAIDLSGYVYVLHSDGTLSKYYSGEEESFQFSGLPNGAPGSLGNANEMYLDLGLSRPGFYVLDRVTQTIYETTLGGTFVGSYRAPEGASFRDLSGLTVDASAENMYVAARDTLYHIPKCN
jgi:hypothetical protein